MKILVTVQIRNLLTWYDGIVILTIASELRIVSILKCVLFSVKHGTKFQSWVCVDSIFNHNF